MSEHQYVQVGREDGVVTLTMDFPARRNAFSLEMKHHLLKHFSELVEDKDCQAIVLTGAGGTFSAGGDISQMKARDPVEMRAYLGISHRIIRLITAGPKPVIAAVEGHAFGAGLSLACAADYVVVSADAKLCCAFIRLGLLPDVGLRWTLSQRVGGAKAKELIMLGSEFDGKEAGRIGVANQVVEVGKTLPTALEVAKRLARRSPTAVALLKASFASGCDSLEAAFQMELDHQPLLKTTREYQEAVKAFLEKSGGRS